jgi:branched-chain amino acid transport system substrate-binding protein
MSPWPSLADTILRSGSWRVLHDRGYPIQLIAGLTLATEEFGLIAGPGAEGTLFIDNPDARQNAEAAPVVERFRASGFEPEGSTLNDYCAVQVWAQAAEKAGSLELPAMIASLRNHQFDTVLGPIGFDQKGDVTLQRPVLYVWQANGSRMLEHGGVNE